MRAVATVVAFCLVAAVAGCSSTDQSALVSAQAARSALASATLAWTQYQANSTLPTVTITTLQDMQKALTDAASELSELPAADTRTATDALHAVREADDAVGTALITVTSGASPIGIGDLLKAATHDLDFAIGALK